MFWNVASVSDEISLHKWSGGTGQFRTLERELVAKMRFVGSNAFFHSCFYTHSINLCDLLLPTITVSHCIVCHDVCVQQLRTSKRLPP